MLKKIIQLALCLLLYYLNGTDAKVAPDFIRPCVGLKSDCLTKTVQEILPEFVKGLPALGIESLDPLKQGVVSLQLPGNFQIHVTNGSMTGLRKCVIDSVSFKNAEADLKLHCDLTIKSKYKANGRILIVTINGDGDAKIKIKNMIINAKIKHHNVVRDGVTYFEIKSYDVNHAYGDKVTFYLTNLFKGNPELSDAVLQFLNQNWKQIAEEFGKPLVDQLVGLVFDVVKKFFKAVPKNELFVPDSA